MERKERLTVPDERIDERTTRRKIIDGEKVREHAMELYWRLKEYEDTGLEPKEISELKAENERLHRENFWLTHKGGTA